jgi:hypothetical protein
MELAHISLCLFIQIPLLGGLFCQCTTLTQETMNKLSKEFQMILTDRLQYSLPFMSYFIFINLYRTEIGDINP